MFNRKRKQLELELQQTKAEVEDLKKKLEDTNELLSFFKSKKKAEQLFMLSPAPYFKDDVERMEFAKQTLNQFNYRDIITRTQSGRIVLDIHQMVPSDYKPRTSGKDIQIN